jgi:uncharacterized metal-binding protein
MKCDLCKDNSCYRGESCIDENDGSALLYSGEDRRIHQAAALIEGKYYMQKTRVEELVLFCREMSYKKLGVAFCIGLQKEANILCSFLRRDFAVSSVCCKICAVSKDLMELKKIDENRAEVMCNPIYQAKKLEECETELNMTVGLCIGHDILFNKHSHVPTTAIIVKDRVLAHNPVGALYSRYYQKILGV